MSDVNKKERESFVGKQIDLNETVFNALAADKDSIEITVESINKDSVLFNLGSGVKLSILNNKLTFAKGDVLVLDKDRKVISEDLEEIKERISNTGSSCQFARYQ